MLGKHSVEVLWRIRLGRDSSPAALALTIDQPLKGSPYARVLWNDQIVFDSKVHDDVQLVFPFRCSIKGLMTKEFEMDTKNMEEGQQGQRDKVKVVSGREDGLYEVQTVDSPLRTFPAVPLT